ncbi:hypothetical protein J6590_000621 [Homalodisca vitripennis]|nr:hypothetical protein J6590_000621 [Homalodisca vitripennis]
MFNDYFISAPLSLLADSPDTDGVGASGCVYQANSLFLYPSLGAQPKMVLIPVIFTVLIWHGCWYNLERKENKEVKPKMGTKGIYDKFCQAKLHRPCTETHEVGRPRCSGQRYRYISLQRCASSRTPKSPSTHLVTKNSAQVPHGGLLRMYGSCIINIDYSDLAAFQHRTRRGRKTEDVVPNIRHNIYVNLMFK